MARNIKADAATVEYRISQICQLIILHGATYTDIRNFAVKNWNITSPKHISDYIQRAKKQIHENAMNDIEEIRAEQNLRLRQLLSLCANQMIGKDENGKTVIIGVGLLDQYLKITMQISKINGLDIQKIEHQLAPEILEKIKEIQAPWYDNEKKIQTKSKTNNRKKNTS